MDDIATTAGLWLLKAQSYGWGVEGPMGHEIGTEAVRALARGESDPSGVDRLAAHVEAMPVGDRPVDALWSAAALLTEAAESSGRRQIELLSAARGWLAGVRDAV